MTGSIKRVPFDVESCSRRCRTGPCFICGIVNGASGQPEEIVYDDGGHIAFLPRFPVPRGHALMVPDTHVKHVVRNLPRLGSSR